jgi:hypothetical protein
MEDFLFHRKENTLITLIKILKIEIIVSPSVLQENVDRSQALQKINN